MNDQTGKQKKANVRLALILGSIAAGFFILGLYMTQPGG